MRIVEIEVKLVHSTERAYLVQSVDTGVETWIPKSKCELDLKHNSDMGILTLEQRDAEQLRLV